MNDVVAEKYLDAGRYTGDPINMFLPNKVSAVIDILFTGSNSGGEVIRQANDIYRIVWETEMRGLIKDMFSIPDISHSGNDTKIIELYNTLQAIGLTDLLSIYSLKLPNNEFGRLRDIIFNRAVSMIDKLVALIVVHVKYMKARIDENGQPIT